jgi:single-strand DNA-binding protein
MNNITLVGRAGRDPEVRYFESGTMVANLSLAVNAYKRDEAPDWFNLTIWGKQAQVAADYVKKGSQIAVSGRMTSEKWTDKTTGEEKSKPVVVVERITLLGSKNDSLDGGGGQAAPAPAAAPARSTASAPAQSAWNTAPLSDEEVPF